MQTWFINGRNMGHAELLRWKAKQALKVEVEVVEPNELKEELKIETPTEVIEAEKVEVTPEVVEIQEAEIVEEVEEEVEPKELGELETPPVITHFCDFCDSKGVRHLKTCKLYKAIK